MVDESIRCIEIGEEAKRGDLLILSAFRAEPMSWHENGLESHQRLLFLQIRTMTLSNSGSVYKYTYVSALGRISSRCSWGGKP